MVSEIVLSRLVYFVPPMEQKYVIRHRVERTKNKHSRAVFRDGTIVIRLANGLSKNEEKEHINDLLKRMKTHVEEEQEKVLIDPFKKMLDGAEVLTVTLFTGKKYQFILKPGKRTRVVRTLRGWKIYIAPSVRRKSLHRLLWKIISHAEYKRIAELVMHINAQTYGVSLSKIKLQFASTQWGSCSPRGVIMINAALLFVQPSILKYVIVHELAHRKRADHSPQYWEWVEWALPNYKKTRQELQECRLPTL